MVLRTAPVAIAALMLTACPDDGDDGDDSNDPTGTDAGTTMSAETTSGTDTGPGGSDSGTTAAPGTDSGSTSDMADSSGTAGTEDSSGTSGSVEPAMLINDGWIDGRAVSFMGGFAQDECWASVYEPFINHYPFTVDAVRMLVGDSMDKKTYPFTLSLYTVDDENRPDMELGSAVVDVTGSGGDFDSINLSVAGIESPIFDEGNFALVVCFSDHGGFPGIAADEDGQIDHPDRNWIFSEGAWVQSGDLGVGGDWVMRAVILPMGG